MAASTERLDVDEESVRDKRLKEILKRKEAVVDMREKARIATNERKANGAQAAGAFRAVLESYITTVQSFFHNGKGPHYWSQKEYGTVTLSPPGRSVKRTTFNSQWQLPNGTKINHRPDMVQADIVGLKTLFDAADPLQVSVEVTYENGRFGTVTDTFTTEGQIPWGILDDMFIDVNNHVANCGIDIGTDTDDRWEI